MTNVIELHDTFEENTISSLVMAIGGAIFINFKLYVGNRLLAGELELTLNNNSKICIKIMPF